MMRRRAHHVRSAAIGLLVTLDIVLSACGAGSPAASRAIPATTAPEEPASPLVTPEPTPPAEPTINTTEITGPLRGAALVQALRTGGLVLWMRHTERDDRSGTVTPEQAATHDCAAQSALTDTGRQHAKQIGAAVRALHLPIAAVRTARLCRTETTGRLLRLAPMATDDRLDASSTWVNRGGAAAQQRATLQILSETPPDGTNVVLVSSVLDIPAPQPAVLHDLGPGETVVFRPGPDGKATLLARIGESAWPMLLQAVIPTAPSPATR
jgi:hypothetical protein